MQPNFTPATNQDFDDMEARQDHAPGVPSFRPFDAGDKVRNQYGELRTVCSVNMPMVRVTEEPNDLYHYTKLTLV